MRLRKGGVDEKFAVFALMVVCDDVRNRSTCVRLTLIIHHADTWKFP
ncbi:MAG: hypothetical protein IJP89_00185 [Synergistaceae bacterium]|nr:hypothetical protein [Synergistaceae bacterium]